MTPTSGNWLLASLMRFVPCPQRSMDSSRARAQRELKQASEAAKQLARARAMVADTEAAIQALNAQVRHDCDAALHLDTRAVSSAATVQA